MQKTPLFCDFFRERPPSGEKAEQQPVNHARAGAVNDHGPGDREHLGAGTGDETFCLCQDRTHKFFAILEFYDSVQR